MSVQIAVRLSNETVAFIDEIVQSGRAGSRAEVVARALAREQRRERSLRDLDILRQGESGEDEFGPMHAYLARRPLDID